MKKLEIDREKMLKVAEGCPDAKQTFKTLWPEEFEPDKPVVWEDITEQCVYSFRMGWMLIWNMNIQFGVIHFEGPYVYSSCQDRYRIKMDQKDGTKLRHCFRIMKLNA